MHRERCKASGVRASYNGRGGSTHNRLVLLALRATEHGKGSLHLARTFQHRTIPRSSHPLTDPFDSIKLRDTLERADAVPHFTKSISMLNPHSHLATAY